MSLIVAYPGLFEWDLLPPALFDMGTLDVTGVRFDVSGAALMCLERLCCGLIWCVSFRA